MSRSRTRAREPGDDDLELPDLSRFDDDFAAAPDPLARVPVPDGTYQVRIDRVDVTTSRSGNPLVRWRLRILGPACCGRLLWRNHVLAAPAQLHWLKRDLRTVGLTLERLSDLPAHLPALAGLVLQVTQRAYAGRTNLYFDRRIEPAVEGCPPAAPPATLKSAT